MIIDHLYEISLYMDYKNLTSLSLTSQYHYNYFNQNNIWYSKLYKDFPYVQDKLLIDKLVYKRMKISRNMAVNTVEMFKNLQKPLYIYLTPSKNRSKFYWLLNILTVSYEDLEIQIGVYDTSYFINLINNDYEYFNAINVTENDLIIALNLLFYHEHDIHFISYVKNEQVELASNLKYRIDYWKKYND
jgi:hypothetical protein